MTFQELLLFILAVQIIHFAGTWKLYKRAGRKPWQAAIPVYNAIVLMRIINRPWWWTILLFIPIVNLIMFPVIWVETIRSFGKNKPADTALVLLTLGFYIFYVSYATQDKYIGNRSLQARTPAGEWVSSILFAVVAATIVHTYVMQPYTIPTSSLEKSLLVGDFLFVSKFHYGAKTPQTAISFPMVHDTIPVLGVKSYLNKPQLPYFRLPGFQEIKRNDIVVFNWPTDTVRMFRDQSGKHYNKPIDKKSNYVKRAVGVPGDSLAIEDGYIFIDGKQLQLPERARPQYSYIIEAKGSENEIRSGLNPKFLYERYGITESVRKMSGRDNVFVVGALSEESLRRFKNHPNVKTIKRAISSTEYQEGNIFPNNNKWEWNRDQFGAIYIPEAGKTVNLNSETFGFYRRIIEVYEGEEMGVEQKLSLKEDQVFLNDEPISTYTFKQNYYWMMGDNRHNSEDSRYWGYVPESHIVGKPVFIWLSIDSNASGILNKIRWERMFTTVSGNGERVSYFPYFLILVILGFGYRLFKKRKKNNE
ncbi:MAG: signal peptidase I [Bacteroidota bacterium]